jgi:hypothetical protein
MRTHRSSAIVTSLAFVAVVFGAACTSDVAEEAEGPAEGASEGALSGAYPVGTPLVTTSAVNLRKTPSPSAQVLAVIPTGTRVASAAAQPRAGWYGVTWQGTTGWVSGAYLQKDTGGVTSGSFSRQRVFELVQGHLRPGAESVGKDLLDPSLTSQKLVDAIGWLATSSPPAWEISAINTNHHYDPAAHSGGYAVDLYAKNAADDLRMVQLVVKDPHFVELGFSGDYVRYGGEVRGKHYFTENAPTHIHAAVRTAFGSPR